MYLLFKNGSTLIVFISALESTNLLSLIKNIIYCHFILFLFFAMRKKKFTPKFKKSVTKMKQLSLKSFSASDRRMLMKKMREIGFFKHRSCGLQALKLYHAILDDDTIDNNKKTYTYIATLFQMKEQNIRSLIMRAKKNDGNVQSKVGRPPLLNKKQEEQLVVIIKERNKQKNCM